MRLSIDKDRYNEEKERNSDGEDFIKPGNNSGICSFM